MDLLDTQLFAVIGAAGFGKLTAAFYRRVPGDAILGPMYAKRDLVEAEHRLRDFLIQRFGGPGDYSARRGHPRLRMRHHPFAIDMAARNRWIELMFAALEEVELPPEAVEPLRKFFAEAATFLVNVEAPGVFS